MAMYHGVDVRPGAIDLGVDETLLIDRAAATINGIAVEIEFHDVVGGDAPRRLRLGNQKMIRPRRMPHADVAVSVDDALVIEDAVGRDEVLDQALARRRIAVVGRRLRGGGTEKEQQCRMCRKPDRSLHVYFLQPRGLSSIWPSIRDSADAANPDPIKRGAVVRHLRAQYEWGSRPARWHLVRRVTCHQARGHYQSARFPGQRSVPCRAPVNLSILCDSPGRTPHHSHSIVACTHRKLTLLEET